MGNGTAACKISRVEQQSKIIFRALFELVKVFRQNRSPREYFGISVDCYRYIAFYPAKFAKVICRGITQIAETLSEPQVRIREHEHAEQNHAYENDCCYNDIPTHLFVLPYK